MSHGAPRSGIGVAAAAFALLALIAPHSASADTETISLLSYNVHGIFALAAKDRPRNRMPTIGWLANRYDVVLLQEDFEYDDIIEEQMQSARRYRGNGIGAHPLLLLVKILGAPLTVAVPRFSPPYGSGLTTYVRESLDAGDDVVGAPYDDCAGWFGEQYDCWARKGWTRVRLRTGDGLEVDVYNTHIEAGSSARSVRSRLRNFEALAAAVETWSAGRAVIVAGDFNVAYSRPRDREAITAFRNRLDLAETGAGPELAVWRERDYILYRDGNRATISLVEAGEATEFVSGARALSDHPALFVTLRVERTHTSKADDAGGAGPGAARAVDTVRDPHVANEGDAESRIDALQHGTRLR